MFGREDHDGVKAAFIGEFECRLEVEVPRGEDDHLEWESLDRTRQVHGESHIHITTRGAHGEPGCLDRLDEIGRCAMIQIGPTHPEMAATSGQIAGIVQIHIGVLAEDVRTIDVQRDRRVSPPNVTNPVSHPIQHAYRLAEGRYK